MPDLFEHLVGQERREGGCPLGPTTRTETPLLTTCRHKKLVTTVRASDAGKARLKPAANGWTDFGSSVCNTDFSLICMESGPGPALKDFRKVGRLAFVTSVFGTGNLQWWLGTSGVGLERVDSTCKRLATEAFLPQPDTFRAWISGESTNAVDRFVNDGPWVRLDGILVAASLADLTDGTLNAPLNVNEFGVYRGNALVWTGTEFLGLGTPDDCDDWTSTAGWSATVGLMNRPDETWTNRITLADCDSGGAFIYCLADNPDLLLFFDGFETGDASKWTSVAP